MSVDEAPDDDEVRQSYNFAPGYHGIIYRADVPDSGAGRGREHQGAESIDQSPAPDQVDQPVEERPPRAVASEDTQRTKYKLQAMKWGLVPFWTKRNPDYGSVLKTINCRDDSLMESRGMWNVMKQRKRCIVVCQGFYEWLKKNNGKDRIPYYTKRKDGQLMCFAGLWDCVQFEGSAEKLYTFTIITTSSNAQLRFLHDRMPVMFDNGSEAIRTWLDPKRSEWSKELQSLLKPYEGELECYQVNKDVGKVGNNSPSFVVPLDSKDNKNNIANFFGGRQAAKSKTQKHAGPRPEHDVKARGSQAEHDDQEHRTTAGRDAPQMDGALPAPEQGAAERGIKREHNEAVDDGDTTAVSPQRKTLKTSAGGIPPLGSPSTKSPATPLTKPMRKTRSAISNGSLAKGGSTRPPDGSRKITSFFGK